MKTIKVLGTGCAKCRTLAANAEAAVRATGRAMPIEKIEDIREIIKYGVISTPALVVDGQVQCTGRVLSTEEIAKLVQ